ncbi:hypothetical protein HMPREF0880_02886 [Yokenella regensburgei ATCC 43003]|nr:hypothetical protein HMPREF0880_02886 [Yokenella regensburgei ATCC 43003]
MACSSILSQERFYRNQQRMKNAGVYLDNLAMSCDDPCAGNGVTFWA